MTSKQREEFLRQNHKLREFDPGSADQFLSLNNILEDLNTSLESSKSSHNHGNSIGFYLLIFLVLFLVVVSAAYSQPTSSTISPRAFGSKSWRENGLAPASLPLVNNTLWDVRLASDGVIYYWDGNSWESIVGSGGSGGTLTIDVGTTTTGLPGTQASVVNSGSETDLILDFTIPRGDVGATGATGENGTDGIDGIDGVDGVDGVDGAPGQAGSAATITVGSTTTGIAGSSASVINTGSSSAAMLEFVIPRGDTGATGATGPTGPAGPIAGSDGQIIYNKLGAASGDLGLTFNDTTDTLSTAKVIATNGGTSSAPGFQIGSTPEGMFYESGIGPALTAASGKYIRFWVNGSARWHIHQGSYDIVNAGGSAGSVIIQWLVGSATVPPYTFTSDLNTGLGWGGMDDLRSIAGGVSVQGYTPDKVTTYVKSVNMAQMLPIADNGNGATRATATLTPTTSYITCTVSDPQGANVSISETTAVDGQILDIVNIGANICGFTDTVGVTEMNGNYDMVQYGSLSFRYVVDRWIERSRSVN
jgi:hypothetical protein